MGFWLECRGLECFANDLFRVVGILHNYGLTFGSSDHRSTRHTCSHTGLWMQTILQFFQCIIQVCMVVTIPWLYLWHCCLCQPLRGMQRCPVLVCFLPIFLSNPRYLEKLPQDVLSALDLGHLTGSLTAPPPPSPLHLLSQRIISNLHSHSGLSPDLQLRAIARELVKFSLASALTKLGLTTTHTLSGNIQVELSQQLNISSWQKHPQCGFEGTAFTSYERQVCNQDKRPSVVSLNSLSSMESEEPETSVLTSSRMLKTLSIQVEGTVIEEVEFEDEWREEEERRVEEDVLQLAAKKIVKKALHLACKKWESVNRRSSIDYLIASTKRLKIASPSPPPTLPEEEKVLYEYGVAASIRPPTGWDTSSPIPDASHGKKRSRSESHDIMMMKELEVFRKTQMMLGQNVGERVIAKPCRTAARGGGGKDRDSAFKRDSSPFHQQESMGDLISDIHRLCIQKADSESEECCSSEEDYTLLSGVTKPATSDSDTASPIPPPNSPTSLQVHRGGLNRCPSPLLQNMLPSALKQIPRWESYAGSSVDEEHVTCTSPEFQQKFSTMGVATASPSRDPFLIIPKDSPVPDMDYYIIVHTRPPPGLCQKFLCGNTNEVNLLYHCWLYPDIPCDSTVVCSEHLSMGVFQPRGVTPVHQDLQDAGVAFCTLQPRSVSSWLYNILYKITLAVYII